MVDRGGSELELQSNCKAGDRPNNPDRRLTDRVGSFLSRADSRRSMVPRGENLSHQCTATESSHFWREVVVANEQHYYNPLYKQIRNHAFAASMSAGDKAPGVYNAKPDNSDCGVHTREREYYCRISLPTVEPTSARMAPLPEDIKQNPPTR